MIAVDTSMSNYHKNLFRIPTISENIALFRSLLDSYEIKPAEALALSGSIHAELRKVKGQDGSAYANYAQTMALLNYYLPDVHQHVVANWQLPQSRPIVSTSTVTKTYTDSLFDDTIAMRAPGARQGIETNKEQPREEGEMLAVPGDEGESGELAEGGEEDEESEEEEPAEAEEPENEEDTEEKEESDSDEIEESEEKIEEDAEDVNENEEWGEYDVEESGADETEFEEEVEEPERQELEYEDISEGESYDEPDMGMEEDEAMAREAAEAAEHMDEMEYEIEPMEEEDPPWGED